MGRLYDISVFKHTAADPSMPYVLVEHNQNCSWSIVAIIEPLSSSISCITFGVIWTYRAAEQQISVVKLTLG